MLSTYQIVLQKYSSQDDICVGTAMANRRAEDERTVGCIMNTVVVRGKFTENQTFLEFINEIKETIIRVMPNQDVPFGYLVDKIDPVRDMSRNPIYQVC